MRHIWHVAFAVTMLALHGLASAGVSEEEEVAEATAVLTDFMNIPENEIPPALLKRAHGIAVIPSVLKVGMILGGRHGSGVIAVRDESGKWSNPAFIKFTGGSIGWQIGASSTDVILIFKSARSVERIAEGEFTLGGDASVAAGPVGRSASAATNANLDAEVYSYSRSRGLFAGLSVEGSALSMNNTANRDFYGEPDISPGAIFARTETDSIPEAGKRFVMSLEEYLPLEAQ